MSLLAGTRRAILGAGKKISYLLRATFDAPDQGYADAQVLDSFAEGVRDGQLTVVEVDGTLAIVSNKCSFTAQTTPVWGDLGFYSQAITRALGRGLLVAVNMGATNKVSWVAWLDAANCGNSDRVYTQGFIDDGYCKTYVADGAGGNLESPSGPVYSASTDYQLAIVLGGADSSGNRFYAGQDKSLYTYGAAFFIRGGSFSDWTLLWLTNQGGP